MILRMILFLNNTYLHSVHVAVPVKDKIHAKLGRTTKYFVYSRSRKIRAIAKSLVCVK
jgi:hypothetical protein